MGKKVESGETALGKEKISSGLQKINNNDIIEERYRILLERTNTVLFEMDNNDTLTYVSPYLAEKYCGLYDGRNITTIMLEDAVIHPDDIIKFNNFLDEYSNGKDFTETTIRMLSRNGDYDWCKWTLTNVYGDMGEKIETVGTIIDVNEYMKAYEVLKYRAEYDALTGVYNSEKFYHECRRSMRACPKNDFAMISVDIDKFKLVNDMYGNVVGDKLLKSVAALLRNECEGKTLFGRMHSDVFSIFMMYNEKKEIETLINRITEKSQENMVKYQVELVFGIWIIDDKSLPTNLMYDRASLARKQVKGSKLVNFAFYDEKYRLQIMRDKEIESEMRCALSAGQFVIYLQPKHELDTGHIVGAEALARWIHPKKGVVQPGIFIPLFEKNGFIVKLDEYIWEETCKTIRNWIDIGLEPIPVSINISRFHIYNENLVDIILGLVRKYKIEPRYLELELTESLFFDDIGVLYKVLYQLQKNGFKLNMDDFGSGYSSLNMLKNVPVDTVKLDKGFLDEILTTEKGKKIVRHSVAMVKDLDLKVIAEGVETQEQLEFLKESDCDAVQGFYFSKPLPVDEFLQYRLKLNNQPMVV